MDTDGECRSSGLHSEETNNPAVELDSGCSNADSGEANRSKAITETGLLTNENVKAHSAHGSSHEAAVVKEEDGDQSSEISEFSDLSHESWQPVQGPIAWVQEQMRKGQSPRKILESLVPKGTIIPEGLDAVMLWKIIINIVSEPPKRKKLEDINTLDDVLHLFRKCKKIIVLTGAGVSVSCGIPDFRSRDGVYARLAKDFPNLPDPQAMFDINFFKSDPRPFFKFAKEIYPGQFKPSLCHNFIKLLESKGKLLRNYTQNIDTLEQEAGIERVIQCHGSFATATCAVCGHKVNSCEIKEDIFKQVIPQCPKCEPTLEQAVMKPDIVFFGESLPEHFHNQMAADKEECDLLIVIGSSLKVRPVALIPNSLPAHVPQVLINRERLHYLNFDVELLGDCDHIVAELCRRMGQGWDHLAVEGSLLHQVLLSNLPTPPISPDQSKEELATEKASWDNVDDGQVSSSSSIHTYGDSRNIEPSSSGESSKAGPSTEKLHKEHHHHQHQKNATKLVLPYPKASSTEQEVTDVGISSSSGGAASIHINQDMERLVSAGHKKDVVFDPGKKVSDSFSSSHTHHRQHPSSSNTDLHSNQQQSRQHHHHNRLAPEPHPDLHASPECVKRSILEGEGSKVRQPSDSLPSPNLPHSSYKTSPSQDNADASQFSAPYSDRKRSASSLAHPQPSVRVEEGECSQLEAKRQKLSTGDAEIAQTNLPNPGSADEVFDSVARPSADCSVELASTSSIPLSGPADKGEREDSLAHPWKEKTEGNDIPEMSTDVCENTQKAWASRARVSIAERLASNQMLFLPPSRYVFKGAEVFSDESDSEDEDDGDCSSEEENETGKELAVSQAEDERNNSRIESTAAETSVTKAVQQSSTCGQGREVDSHQFKTGDSQENPSVTVAKSHEAAYEGLQEPTSSLAAVEPTVSNIMSNETDPSGDQVQRDKVECIVSSTEDLPKG